MEHHTNLTASEIGGLCISFVEGTMMSCIFKYLVKNMDDEEIKKIYS
jgi:hypothetical protein